MKQFTERCPASLTSRKYWTTPTSYNHYY